MANPEDYKYSKEHEWIRVEDGVGTIGITNYAQGELGEVVYVEVETVGETLDQNDIFGTVEAVKVTSDLFMPVSGKVIAFNPDLDENEGDNAALINEDPYTKGWIIKVELSDPSELDALMTFEEYGEMTA